MQDQIIYTRCYPKRMLKDGSVDRHEGFGIFSMSKQLIALSSTDKNLLLFHLQQHNAGTEMNVKEEFTSYEYFLLPDGAHAAARTTAKPRCTDSREAGDKHRAGNYTKQCYIGRDVRYPFEWFDSPLWDAHAKSDNAYYLDREQNAEPPFLESVPDENPLWHDSAEWQTLRDSLRAFIADGRTETFKAAAHFLLSQFSLPVQERSVLIIRDVPQNMEKWTAALALSMPADMAAQMLSFNTNMARLSSNAVSQLFYYLTPNGDYSSTPKNASFLRRPYYMIVGIHPNDPFSTVQRSGGSPFQLLDGKTLRFSYVPDYAEADQLYYTALAELDPELQGFLDSFVPRFQIPLPDMRLPALYRAYYAFLQHPDQIPAMSYQDICSCLRTLEENGLPSDDILQSEIAAAGIQDYPQRLEDDAASGFTLCNTYYRLAESDLDRSSRLIEILVKWFRYRIRKMPIDAQSINRDWESFCGCADRKIRETVVQVLLSEETCTQALSDNDDSEKPECLFNMLLTASKHDKQFFANNAHATQYAFLTSVLSAMAANHESLTRALKIMSETGSPVQQLLMDIGKKQPPKTRFTWWNNVCEYRCMDLIPLCELLAQQELLPVNEIEDLILQYCQRTTNLPGDSLRALSAVLSRCNNAPKSTGERICKYLICQTNPGMYSALINEIQSIPLFYLASKRIFQFMDDKLLQNEGTGFQCLNSFRSWERQIQARSCFILLTDSAIGMKKGKTIDEIGEYLDTIKHADLKMPPSFPEWKTWAAMAESVTKDSNPKDSNPYLPMMFLMMFRFDRQTDRNAYAERLLRYMLEDTLTKNQTVEQLIQICYMLCIPKMDNYCTLQEWNETRKAVLTALHALLPEYYRSGMRTAARKMRLRYPSNMQSVFNLLDRLLAQQEEQYAQQKGGLLQKIFRNPRKPQ